MPNSFIVTWPAVEGRALRANRSAHERRAWARCARDRITSALGGEAAAGGGRLTSMRWCRRSCIQARRCSLRLQSRKTQRRGTNPERMEQATSPTRLRGCLPMPLTLPTLWAAAAIADLGAVEHAQTAIGFV